MLDPGIDALLRLIQQAGYPPMSESTPEVARKGFRAMTVDTVTDDARVAVGDVRDLVLPGPDGDLPARRYRPDGEGPFPTLVFLHGGGFVIGDLDTHDQTCRRLCAGAEAVVLAVDYRLAPEHPFPAAVDDTLAAVRWAHEHDTDPDVGLGGSGILGVIGDSAGGNLSAVAAQALPDLVDAQILIYPATDMTGDFASRHENGEGYFLDLATMLWFGGHYLGESPDVEDPRHSPLRAGDDVLAKTPRAWVCVAEYDPLRDEGEAYASALAAAGVPTECRRFDSLIHGFIDMGLMSPAADEAMDEIVTATRALLHP